MSQKPNINVLAMFTLSGVTYALGPATVPAGAVEKLVRKGLAEAISGEAGEQAQDTEALEAVIRERDALQAQLEQQAAKFDASYAEVVQENEALKKGFALEPHQVELIGVLHPIGAGAINELLRAGLDSKEKVQAATAKELADLPRIGKSTAAQIHGLLKG